MFDPNDPAFDAITDAQLLELAELLIADGLFDLTEDALDNLEPATPPSSTPATERSRC